MRRSASVFWLVVTLALLNRGEAHASSLSEDLFLLIPPSPPGSTARVDGPRREMGEIRLVALGSIRLYQILLSSQGGRACSFTPSCSHFAQEAIARFGMRGVLLASDRVQRCHPLDPDRYSVDPVTGKRVDPVDGYVSGAASEASIRELAVHALVPEELACTPHEKEGEARGRSDPGTGTYLSIRRFADNLRDERDWLRAATEYRRCLASAPPFESVDTLSVLLGVCLRKGGEPLRAVHVLQGMPDRCAHGDLSRVAVREIALAHYGSGRLEEGKSFLEELAKENPVLFRASGGEPLLGIGCLFRGEWREAGTHFVRATEDTEWPDPAELRALGEIAREGASFRRKSPALAGCFSAVLPGAGKAYAGRSLDGLYSFLTVGLTLWQSIEGFSENGAESGRGWVYGTMASGFYAGNLYGSVVAARLRNETFEVAQKSKTASIAFGVRFR